MRKNLAGFSLLEMSIVLAVVSFLLAGMLPALSGQVEQRRNSETRKQLDEIQQALLGFAISNGRLPCPADRTIPSGQANAGVEATTGIGSALTCTNLSGSAAWGVLPWATLGVGETDAWGRRFTYRVSRDFADAVANTSTYGGCTPAPLPAQSSFALCSNGNLTVLSAASSGSNVAIGIPAIVISHGTNGYGAYTSQGSALPASNDPDEVDNYNTTNTNYVSHDFTPGFDDLVVWVSPNILLNRMVSAGKLP